MKIRLLILFLAGLILSNRAFGFQGEDKSAIPNDMAIVIAFPEIPIAIPTNPSIWNFFAHLFDMDKDDHLMVGHAGIILVEGETGNLKYFDFGRYDQRESELGPRPENFGVTRSPETVKLMDLDIKAEISDGIINNLDEILIHVAIKPCFKDYGRLEGAVYYDLDLKKMESFARAIEDDGYVKYGCPAQQYCSRFSRQIIRAGGGDFPPWSYSGMQMVNYVRRIYPVNR
jgi:hypothetical protein